MIPATLRLPIARITRTRRAWLPILAWSALALVTAFVERSRGASHAADHALLGTFGGIALPFLAYAVVGAALGGDGLARSGRSLVSFGAAPVRVALSSIGVSALASALLAALLAALVAAIAHGAADPPLVGDIVTSAWVSAVGGAAYAALFAFGASLGKRGMGRTFFLTFDWILGLGSGFGALVTPRAHLRSLLGGPSVMALSGRASLLCLVVIAALCVAIATRRAER